MSRRRAITTRTDGLGRTMALLEQLERLRLCRCPSCECAVLRRGQHGQKSWNALCADASLRNAQLAGMNEARHSAKEEERALRADE